MAPPGVLLCDALCGRVLCGYQMPHGLDGVVAKPHLTTADEIDLSGDDLPIILGDFAHRLDDIEKRHVIRCCHENGLLTNGFTVVRLYVSDYP